MDTPLRVLLTEDSEDDAALLLRHLQRDGYQVTSQRVDTFEAMSEALASKAWDIVIADYAMPQFSGMAALGLVQRKYPDLPFIMVSGSAGEEIAVEVMRAGAHDYILKGNLARLAPVVKREIRDATIRKERREALAARCRSEAQYRALFEASADAVMLLDEKGFLDCNPAALRMFGLANKDEFISLHPAQLSPARQPDGADSWAAANERLAEAFEDGVNRFEWLHHRHNGNDFAADVLLTAFRLDDRRLLLATVRDISERKKAEHELAESELRYRRITEAVTDYIFTVRVHNGHPIETIHGSNCVAVTGYTNDEYVADPNLWMRMVHQDDRDLVIRQSARILSERRLEPIEHRIHRKDDVLRWVRNTIVPHYDSEGHLLTYDGLIRDITDYKRAEEELARYREHLKELVRERTAELRQSEDRLRNIVMESPFPEMVHAEDGQVLMLSRAWTDITGYELTEIPTISDWTEKAYGDRKDVVRADIDRLYGMDSRTHEGEFIITTKSGEQRVWEFVSTPLGKLPDGRRAAISAAMDVTDRRRTEQEIQRARQMADQASRAKSEFLAMMSHELRTPLNGVIGTTELLLGTNLDAQQRRYAWLAKSSGDALLSLINDVLDFSKIEAGKLELEDINFDLRYAVESVAASLASHAESKELELVAGVHLQVPPLVRGDSGRLQQILRNLVHNAIKFTETGEVAMRATLEEENEQHAVVRFTVNDTGIGIPHDRLTRLFESFSQVDASTTRKYGGSGLGLAICKRLVELMGGQIGVISEEGKGSTFWFTVPLEKQPADASHARALSGDLRNLRVLVVDDNATNREILHEQLASWHMEHQAVPDGEHALAMLRDAALAGRPFGLAILDMQMPGMDGRELAKTIRADARIQDTVLILLTSSQEEHDPKQLRSEGFAGYSVKPVRQSQLLDTIAQAVACAVAPPVVGLEVGQAESAEPIRRRQGGSKGARILLAEDHPISQEVATTILRQAGYQCDAAANGRQALEAVMGQPYDLVLMDCQMPEMDGFTATKAIRQAEQDGQAKRASAGRLPIIALTANAISGDRERCLEAGMDGFLSKPLNPDRLIDLIESSLARTVAPHGPEDGLRLPEQPPQCDAPSVTQHEARPPFDLEMAVKQWGGDRDLVLKLIPKFQTQTQSELQQLEQSITAGDAKRTAELAHGLKGSASYVCARGIRDLAAQLEAMGRKGDLSTAGAVLAELRVELQRCFDFSPQSEPATAGTGV